MPAKTIGHHEATGISFELDDFNPYVKSISQIDPPRKYTCHLYYQQVLGGWWRIANIETGKPYLRKGVAKYMVDLFMEQIEDEHVEKVTAELVTPESVAFFTNYFGVDSVIRTEEDGKVSHSLMWIPPEVE